MSTARARTLLLEHLTAGSTALLALLFDLRGLPIWCDGRDAQGRARLLVGGQQLRRTPHGADVIAEVLRCLAEGSVPDGVHVVTYAPAASAAIAEILGGTHDEHLLDGPRGSGKTQAVPGALAGLAELNDRA